MASSRSAWRSVAWYVDSDTPATATQPEWPASGAAMSRAASSSTGCVTVTRACRAAASSLAVTSGTVPASALAPRTLPDGSMTWVT